LAYDSRRVEPGFLFFAFPGSRADGRASPRTRSPAAPPRWSAESEAPEGIRALDCRGARPADPGAGGAQFYGKPDERLGLTGITGTNGKTTTAYLIDSILRAAGKTTAMIGTIEYHLAGPRASGRQYHAGIARSDAPVQRARAGRRHARHHGSFLARAGDWAASTAAISHRGVHQPDARSPGLSTAPWRLTSPPSRLCSKGAGGTAAEIRGAQSRRRNTPADQADAKTEVLWYGLGREPNLRARHISSGFQGLRFDVQFGKLRFAVESPLIGKINVYNILAACGAGLSYGIAPETVARGIAGLQAVPGRFERIDEGQPFVVVVDYAHTDDALRNTIAVARGLNPKRVITLFGCGGDRDRAKRPLMGQAAAEGSDFVVLTSDNPRSEDPLAIMNDALVGIRRWTCRTRSSRTAPPPLPAR
jgi:UDP-N-acetylmuramoyl-L-alanyl-D-glutamate--2,6-diaminopimelate ligase